MIRQCAEWESQTHCSCIATVTSSLQAWLKETLPRKLPRGSSSLGIHWTTVTQFCLHDLQVRDDGILQYNVQVSGHDVLQCNSRGWFLSCLIYTSCLVLLLCLELGLTGHAFRLRKKESSLRNVVSNTHYDDGQCPQNLSLYCTAC